MTRPLRSQAGCVHERVRWLSAEVAVPVPGGPERHEGVGPDELPDRFLRAQVPTKDRPHYLKTCRVAQAELQATSKLSSSERNRCCGVNDSRPISDLQRGPSPDVADPVGGGTPSRADDRLMGHGVVAKHHRGHSVRLAGLASGVDQQQESTAEQPTPAGAVQGSGSLNTASARRPGRRRSPSKGRLRRVCAASMVFMSLTSIRAPGPRSALRLRQRPAWGKHQRQWSAGVPGEAGRQGIRARTTKWAPVKPRSAESSRWSVVIAADALWASRSPPGEPAQDSAVRLVGVAGAPLV